MEVLSLYCATVEVASRTHTHRRAEHSKQNMRKNFALLPFGRISNQLCSRPSSTTILAAQCDQNLYKFCLQARSVVKYA